MPKRGPILKNTRNEPEVLVVPGTFLREVRRGTRGPDTTFPFTVPVIRALERLAFPTAVTFLVGENGSGKSTLLEGIASAAALPSGRYQTLNSLVTY